MAFRCTRLALQGAGRQSSSSLLPSAAAAPSSSRIALETTRSFASSSKTPVPEVRSASASLSQLRKQMLSSGSSETAQPSAASSRPSAGTVQDEFEIPVCLLPTETAPQTHGNHVATLHLRCYTDSLQNLELFCDFARKAAFALAIPVSNVAHLPVRTSLWTVPRSPFVHKKSQENFWRKTHSRAIKVYDANDEVVDRWLHFLRIHAMPGVGMKAELMRYHEVGVGSMMMAEAEALQRPSATIKSLTAKSKGEKPEKAAGAAAAAAADAQDGEAKTTEQMASDVQRIADDIVAKETAAAEAEAAAETQATNSEAPKQEEKNAKEGGKA